MLEFKPESIESMIKRLPKALDKIWYVYDGMQDRPGMHREHVFDFENGLRLLISRDKLQHIRNDEIHVSASWEQNPPKSIGEMISSVEYGYRILGGKGILVFVGWSDRAIPHWVVEKES